MRPTDISRPVTFASTSNGFSCLRNSHLTIFRVIHKILFPRRFLPTYRETWQRERENSNMFFGQKQKFISYWVLMRTNPFHFGETREWSHVATAWWGGFFLKQPMSTSECGVKHQQRKWQSFRTYVRWRHEWSNIQNILKRLIQYRLNFLLLLSLRIFRLSLVCFSNYLIYLFTSTSGMRGRSMKRILSISVFGPHQLLIIIICTMFRLCLSLPFFCVCVVFDKNATIAFVWMWRLRKKEISITNFHLIPSALCVASLLPWLFSKISHPISRCLFFLFA